MPSSEEQPVPGGSGREVLSCGAGGGTASAGGWSGGAVPTGIGAVGEALSSAQAPTAESAEPTAERGGKSVPVRTDGRLVSLKRLSLESNVKKKG